MPFKVLAAPTSKLRNDAIGRNFYQMKIPRKQRAPQGIYAQPPQVRARIGEMLKANAMYREIRTKLLEEFDYQMSITSLGNYRAARIMGQGKHL